MNPQTPQKDEQAIALTKAIRQKESGGDYNAVGDVGTSTGAYQYQSGTWKMYAKEILGDENAEMSEPNQNAVTYGKIKQWKDQGLGPAEIAARWNAGDRKDWQNHIGTTTINGKQVSYNTPQYVKDVVDIFKKNEQKQVPTAPKQTFGSAIQNIQEQQPAPEAVPEKKDGFGKSLLKSLVKSPLTMLARPIQAGFALAGVPAEKIDKVTKDIAGDYVAPTPKSVGDVGKDVLRGAETVATGYSAVKGTKALTGVLKGGPALKSPEVVKILKAGLEPGRGMESLTREAAVTRLTAQLNRLKTSEIGSPLEQKILQALKELVPSLPEKKSLIKSLISGNKIGLLDLVGAGTIVKPLVAPVKEAVTGTGKFTPK